MIESTNRAFMYGESVFTTMRMKNGQILDWEAHFDRFKRGVEFLYGPFTDGEDWARLLKNRVETRCFMTDGDKVIRLTAYLEQARGLARWGLISVMDIKFNVSSSQFDFSRVEGSIRLRSCPGLNRPHWWPSYLKAGNYLHTILAQKMFMKDGDDDVLFLSPEDTILESSVANIFVVRHNKIYTAPLGPNVLDGIMRKRVIELGPHFFTDCIESASSMEQVLKADGIFGSNSVRGIFLVDRIDDYEITPSREFLDNFAALRAALNE